MSAPRPESEEAEDRYAELFVDAEDNDDDDENDPDFEDEEDPDEDDLVAAMFDEEDDEFHGAYDERFRRPEHRRLTLDDRCRGRRSNRICSRSRGWRRSRR